MIEHRMEGWWPGTLVGVYEASAQEARRADRKPPTEAPRAIMDADPLGVATPLVPEGRRYGVRQPRRRPGGMDPHPRTAI
jgi:hypothetical protein